MVEYTYVPQRNNTEDLSRIADYPSSFTVPESIVLFGRGKLDGTGRRIDVISERVNIILSENEDGNR